MDVSQYLIFALASLAIILVPGPTVTVIIANSLRDGAQAGLLNVAGTQLGMVVVVVIIAFGLESVATFMAEWFYWIKLVGAGYLIWLGVKLWLSDGSLGKAEGGKAPRIGYFWQGFFVLLSNPKALLFLGAFIPQFIDPAGNAFWQTLYCGLIFMAVGAVFDSMYALLAGKAGEKLTKTRVRFAEKTTGSLLIGGGIWMTLLKRA